MADKKTILVTGANGQLGNEMRVVSATYTITYNFLFVTKQDLPVDDINALKKYFENQQNC